MKTLAYAAFFAVVSGVSAHAASLVGPINDAEFNALCESGGDTEACLIGAGDIQLGNAAANGDREIGAGESTGGPLNSAQFDFESGQTEAFSFTSDGSKITTTVGTTSAMFSLANLSDAASLIIRGTARNGGEVELTDLMLDGMSLGDITFTSTAQLFQAAIDSSFDLSGNITFTFDDDLRGPGDADGKQGGAFNAVQFKVTDVAPIPLPATAWLLLAGLGALGGMRLRRAA